MNWLNWLGAAMAGAVVFFFASLALENTEGPLKTWAPEIAGTFILLAVGIISQLVKKRKPKRRI